MSDELFEKMSMEICKEQSGYGNDNCMVGCIKFLDIADGKRKMRYLITNISREMTEKIINQG